MKVRAAVRMANVQEYYFSRKLKEITQRRISGANIINLGIGSPDLAPPAAVVDALSQSLAAPGIHQYQSYAGIQELREAMADWYACMYGVTLDSAREVLPLIGSKEGIMHISMAYLSPGDQVLVPDPGYPTYTAAAELSGASIIKYKLHEETAWLPDLEALSLLDLKRVKIMWINYPHMPTGAIATSGFFEKLIAWARKHRILICNDNPYSLILNETPLSILQIEGAKEVALELNSLSKSHHMAGWRIGMVCAAEEHIANIIRFKSNMDSGMFRGLQVAAVAALQTPTTWHTRQNEIYRERKKTGIQILQQIGCTVQKPQAGLFVWGRIPPAADDGFSLSEDILNAAEMFITPGGIFGEQGKNYLRLSLCNPVQRLQEALDRLKKIKPTAL